MSDHVRPEGAQGQITAVGTDVAALKGEVVVTRDVLLAAIQGLDQGPSR